MYWLRCDALRAPTWTLPIGSIRLLLSLSSALWLFQPAFTAAQTEHPTAAAVYAGDSGGAGRLTRIYPLHPRNVLSGKQSVRTGSTTTAATGGPDLQYYGGPVISNVQVVVVYWGNSVSSVATTGIPGFFSSITNSNWADELSEYTTNGVIPVGGGTPGNQSIGRGSLSGVYTI